jgi:hypothetical protein
MNRKDYQKPTMKVVLLQYRSHILAGSATGNVSATMSGSFTETDDWDEE